MECPLPGFVNNLWYISEFITATRHFKMEERLSLCVLHEDEECPTVVPMRKYPGRKHVKKSDPQHKRLVGDFYAIGFITKVDYIGRYRCLV